MNVRGFLFLGDVPSAVLLFEAGCQLEPENPEAWFLLGTSQVSIDFFDHLLPQEPFGFM